MTTTTTIQIPVSSNSAGEDKRTRGPDISGVVAPDVNIRALSPEQIARVMQELEDISRNGNDYVTDTTNIQLYGDAEEGDVQAYLSIGGLAGTVRFPAISRHAHGQIAEAMSIPRPYYNRMLVEAPELLASNVNHWLHNDKAGRKFLVRTVGNTIRALLSNRYKTMDNFDLFRHTYETGKSVNAKVARLDLTDERFYMRLLKDDWALRLENQRTVATKSTGSGIFHGGITDTQGHANHNPGTMNIVDKSIDGAMYDAATREDLIIPGLVVSNSEVGMGRLMVEMFMFFTYCMNGAIIGQSIAKVHLGQAKEIEGLLSDETQHLESAAIWSAVTDLVKASFDIDVFTNFVNQMNEARRLDLDMERTPEGLIKVTAPVVKHYGFTDADTQRIIFELMSEGDYTVFGLLNAVTAVGREKPNYNEGARFERAGADIIHEVVGKDNRELVRVRR